MPGTARGLYSFARGRPGISPGCHSHKILDPSSNFSMSILLSPTRAYLPGLARGLFTLARRRPGLLLVCPASPGGICPGCHTFELLENFVEFSPCPSTSLPPGHPCPGWHPHTSQPGETCTTIRAHENNCPASSHPFYLHPLVVPVGGHLAVSKTGFNYPESTGLFRRGRGPRRCRAVPLRPHTQ